MVSGIEVMIQQDVLLSIPHYFVRFDPILTYDSPLYTQVGRPYRTRTDTLAGFKPVPSAIGVKVCAARETRTLTVRVLSPVPLPLGYCCLDLRQGFEPRFTDSESAVLPLYYLRTDLGAGVGPALNVSKTPVLPLYDPRIFLEWHSRRSTLSRRHALRRPTSSLYSL